MRFEPLSYMLLNGLADLSYEAWLELEREHKGEPYSPDWESYQNMEDKQTLRFIALRDDKTLIGYASLMFDTDQHRAKILTTVFRDIYITPTKRGYAASFIMFIERQLKDLGVRRTYIAERLDQDGNATRVGEFYRSIGYAPQECLWGKTLYATLH